MRIEFNPDALGTRRPFKQLGKAIGENQRATFGVARDVTANVAGTVSDVATATTVVGLGVIGLVNPFNWRLRS